ncbi:unnamed protein product [Litomosoides sigmodontis]|uniref:Uncharacterized protein n=1 Tax=Litomosoides sigmodontis TaxID=42156 RepID=A0A3P6TMH8_LITSI|nr:unnamed protein product [Litomosoides sigmodontis]
MNGKEIEYLTKLDESIVEAMSDETIGFAENANASVKELESVPNYLFYKNEQQHAILNTFSKIDAGLMLTAVLAIVISCVMVAIEIRNYKLYQTAKNKPVKLVLTREFLERIRIDRYKARQPGTPAFNVPGNWPIAF